VIPQSVQQTLIVLLLIVSKEFVLNVILKLVLSVMVIHVLWIPTVVLTLV
jgi:hypothetical protein